MPVHPRLATDAAVTQPVAPTSAALRPAARWLLGSGVVLLALLAVDPARGWLREWPGRWLHVMVVALVTSAVCLPLARGLARRVGAIDLPDRRKVHHRPTPRLGGLAVFAGIAVALALNGIPDPAITMMVLAAAGLLVVGALDDTIGVSARLRLLAQAGASLLVVQSGVALTLLPHESWLGAGGNAALTVLWLVGITNAFNFFDGMDGLAGGLAVVMAGFLSVIAFLTDQHQLGWSSVAIIGACLGFLPFNFKLRAPATVFLGDGGSTVLGFLLACLAVHGEWAVDAPLVNLTAPLLIFGILIFDMIHTTVSRIARGDVRSVRAWLEYTGRDHLHHRFESLLRSKRGAVLAVLLLAVTLGVTALLIRSVDRLGALLLLLQCAAILLVVTVLEYAGNRRERRTR